MKLQALCSVIFLGWIKNNTLRLRKQIFLFPEGFSISGGHNSLHQVVYISDVNPRSVAATEGNLQLLDIIHYVNGVSTQGMTLEAAERALDMSLPSLVLKATRYLLCSYLWVLSVYASTFPALGFIYVFLKIYS